jgi:hypothetical protein
MKKSSDGPIVDAVRRARRKIAKECGYDLHKLFELARKAEKTSGGRFATSRRRGRVK